MKTDTTNLEAIRASTVAVISQEAISDRVDNLRWTLSERIDQVNAPVILLILGKGGHVVAQKLLFGMEKSCQVHYMYASTYGSGEYAGEFRVLFETAKNYEGAHVIIIDDMCDTGTTPHNVQQICLERGARSVEGLFLLQKPSRQKFFDFKILDVGFQIKDIFVFGWGMDAYGFDVLRRHPEVSCLQENLPNDQGPDYWIPNPQESA